LGSDDQVVEEPEADDASRLGDLGGGAEVVRTRREVARGVVVGEGEGDTVIAEDAVQHLPDW